MFDILSYLWGKLKVVSLTPAALAENNAKRFNLNTG